MNPRLILGTAFLAGITACLIGRATGHEERNAPTNPVASAAGGEPVVAQRAVVISDEEAVLASDRPGILEFVEPQEGDRVTAGQQIAGLKDEVAKAALAVAEATAATDIEIRYARAAAGVAELEYEKSVEGNRLIKDLVTKIDIERLKLAAERARLQTEKAEIDQQIARLTTAEKAAELETYRIVTPIDGVVTEVLKHSGEAVQQGDPILRIVQTDVVRIEGFVGLADALRIKPGDLVRIQIDSNRLRGLPDELKTRHWEGKVAFVDPTAKLVSNGVRVWATVKNDGNVLRAGLPATMEIRPTADAVAETLQSEIKP